MLKPVIVQNLDLLRQIRAWSGDAPPTAADLARALERDADNTRKSLIKLADEGVVARLDGAAYGLTAVGDRMLRAAAIADGEENPAAGVEGITGLLWDQILPDADNARRDWTSEEATEALAELADSIAERGLLQNLIVRPELTPDLAQAGLHDANGVRLPSFVLIGGERRWRAIGQLIAKGRWDRTQRIPCRIRDADPREAALDALAENMKRRDLKPLEEARAFRKLVDDHDVKTADIAAALNCSQRVIQQRLQLLELDAADQARLEAGSLKLEDARRIIADRPDPLTPGQLLVLAEVADAVKWSPGSHYWDCKTPNVQAAMADDPAAEFFAKAAVFHRQRDDGTQLFQVQALYSFDRYAKAFLKGWAEDPKAALDRIRAEVLGQGEAARLKARQKGAKTWATAWLNGPFELDDQGREALAKRAEYKAQQKRDEDERREREKFRLQAEAHRRHQVDQLQSDLRETIAGAPRMEDFVHLADALNHPLPWCVDPNGQVRDARNGYVRLDYCYGEGDSKSLQILAITAINAAAGLGTPLEPPKPAEAAADDQAADNEGELTDEEAAGISAEMRQIREADAAELASA
jgi:ParB/RepB/Spo0J family partition protein